MRLPVLILLAATALPAAENLIRNGSFEHSRQYWMEPLGVIDDAADAPHGSSCLRMDTKGAIRSMPFELEPGRTVTISLWARSEATGKLGISPSPSNRLVGQQTGWLWNAKRTLRAEVGPEWQRVSVRFEVPSEKTIDGTHDGSNSAWWNERSWIVRIGGPKPLWIDGVTVAYDDAGVDDFVPYTPLEVTATAIDLPGYAPHANLLDPTTPVTVRGVALNPGDQALDATLRFEQLDYTGTRTYGEPIDHAVTIPPRGSVAVDQPTSLRARGMVLARVSLLRDDAVVATSDQPLTALAFPKAATEHDPRERFGGSFRSTHLAEAGRKIGLAWARWYPHYNWGAIQKEGADDWNWPVEREEHLWSIGIAPTAVLHAVPKWARADKDGAVDAKHLAADMQWPADDPRWDDLSIVTGWDRFVTAIATRYRGKPMVYEFANEPDISKWDVNRYRQMLKRTDRVLKAADPDAHLLVNETWPGVHGWTRNTITDDGLAHFDGHSFHNYTPGELSDTGGVTELKRLFASYGDGDKSIWFNEGWTYVRSSLDYPAAPLVFDHAAIPADIIVRSASKLIAVGLDKFIPFHIGYGQHGKSLWDWVGSGTEWWDDHGYPTVAVGAYNSLAHFIGLSEPAGVVEAEGAVFQVFHDLRGERGVAVAWATAEDGAELPLAADGLEAFDIMGNLVDVLAEGRLRLATTGRPVYLVGAADGAALLERLAPLQVDHSAGGFAPPEGWFGTAVGTSDGNPLLVDGEPRWRLDQIWPDDPTVAANYQPMIWNGTGWNVARHGHGGQPGIETAKAHYRLVGRGAWGGNKGQKIAALSFIAPEDGTYRLEAAPRLQNWDGKGKTIQLRVLVRRGDAIEEVHRIDLPDRKRVELRAPAVELAAGEHLVLVPRYPQMHVAGGIDLRDLRIVVE